MWTHRYLVSMGIRTCPSQYVPDDDIAALRSLYTLALNLNPSEPAPAHGKTYE